MEEIVTDQDARFEAIDGRFSFIVRAPAGAGKTQLLTLRFLALLAHVQKNPEEILAITFTRLAAGEMRERILVTLKAAADGSLARRTAWDEKIFYVTKKVLERDQQEKWNLLKNPNRLCILTIDAFCAQLVAKMPMSKVYSSRAKLSENPTNYYLQAARQVLKEIDSDEAWSSAVEVLLNHFDNAHERIEALLVDMLSKRDQWLPHLMRVQSHDRVYLEEGLGCIVQEALDAVVARFPKDKLDEVMRLWNKVQESNTCNPQEILRRCAPQDDSIKKAPQDDNAEVSLVDKLEFWTSIANFLLTAEKKWRKTVTKREGFPAGKDAVSKKMKTDMLNLLEDLQQHDDLRQLLAQLSVLPPLNYSDQQWNVVIAWQSVLRLLAAHLKIIFEQEQITDYLEIALKAEALLGDEKNPSDLAFFLDQEISHILVDEFQDTSSSQWRLLEKLTLGWSLGDGKTLFLVGDPMQSIYRFRKAEVGLFLRAWQQGLPNVALKPLALNMNFRAQANLVDWVNQLFSRVMPVEESIAQGAIKYIASNPAKVAEDNVSTTWYPLLNSSLEKEAQTVVEIIETLKRNDPFNTSIAILVKSRQQVRAILPALRSAGIAYQATEIDPLHQRPVISDLLALTRAFLNPFDRIAWLASLRSPWCGLVLEDLYEIAGKAVKITIWEKCLKSDDLNLTEEGRKRLNHFMVAMHDHQNRRNGTTLRWNIEKIWNDLGGPRTLNDIFDYQSSQIFFDLLSSLEEAGDIPDIDYFENCLAKRYSNALFMPDEVPSPYPLPQSPLSRGGEENIIEIMTIHKAKGLEFDHVIVPGLQHQTAHDEAQLLLWSEYRGSNARDYLILGPIKDTENKMDPMYHYLRQQESEKARHEMLRLFYVATTRAKKSLHLIGSVDYQADKGIKNPPSQSFLGLLWSEIKSVFQAVLAEERGVMQEEVVIKRPPRKLLKRLKLEFLEKCKVD